MMDIAHFVSVMCFVASYGNWLQRRKRTDVIVGPEYTSVAAVNVTLNCIKRVRSSVGNAVRQSINFPIICSEDVVSLSSEVKSRLSNSHILHSTWLSYNVLDLNLFSKEMLFVEIERLKSIYSDLRYAFDIFKK
jgi:hypothetical protein